MTLSNTRQSKIISRPRVAIAAFLLGLVLVAIGTETICSVALIHYYRFTGALGDGLSQSSAVAVIEKVLSHFNLYSNRYDEPSQSSDPVDFFRHDNVLGYTANAGRFTHNFMKWKNQKFERLPIKVTINPDSSRWTGRTYDSAAPNIFIFGDSFVFGYGVNDEQTFSYLLQAEIPDKNVHLFALSGYGLSQTYLRFEQIKNRISDKDIIIIGYADFYDARNVAAPSLRNATYEWLKSHESEVGTINDFERVKAIIRWPRATITPDNRLVFDLVNPNCEASSCADEEPSQEYMTTVSARLINKIVESTQAKVYVLHFDGSIKNPLLSKLDKRADLISVLPEDFGHFMRDDIAGFDKHPGPYWHYAISRVLIKRLVDKQR
jgi:hypothetical protein